MKKHHGIIDTDSEGVIHLCGNEYYAPFFSGNYDRRIIKGVGHNLPQDAPEAFALEVLSFVQ